ncbi:MAG TPA: metallophosphoesterase [Chthoniobacteraceae bacterium]|nr:metallophosphoesterase [Chthoniobacteraceae bacterium]
MSSLREDGPHGPDGRNGPPISEAGTRRRFLRLATAGAAGLTLPGAHAASERPSSGFTFAVANDLHYRDARCGDWLRRVADHVRAQRPRPAFLVLAGDLSEDGTPEQLTAVRRIFTPLPMPVKLLIGNHDHTVEGDCSAYEAICGAPFNYRFDHGGCQFLALDTTQGRSVYRTRIAASTFDWVDAALPSLSRERPTIVLTHFPLGRNWLRPLNAHRLLERFREQRLLATFSGHWHGITERQEGSVHLSTGRCCAWWRENHDGSDEKGYTLCQVSSRRSEARVEWAVEHRFVAVA